MQENYKSKKKLRKIINVILIILSIGIILTILLNQNIINTLQNRIQENSNPSDLETNIDYEIISQNRK